MSARKIRPNDGWLRHVEGRAAHRDPSLATELASDGNPGERGGAGLDLGPERAALRRLADQRAGRHAGRGRRRDHRGDPAREIPPQEDIAEAIVFFASGMSRVITGQSLDVNGGEFFG